jgi:hypothetical protein
MLCMYVHHSFCHVPGYVLPSGEQGLHYRCIHAVYFAFWFTLYAVLPQVEQLCNLWLMTMQYLFYGGL